jgi:hypothetical protein
LAQTSVKVNDVLAHPGKRCRDTYQIFLSLIPSCGQPKFDKVPLDISSTTAELILICFTGQSDNLVFIDKIGILDFGVGLNNGI